MPLESSLDFIQFGMVFALKIESLLSCFSYVLDHIQFLEHMHFTMNSQVPRYISKTCLHIRFIYVTTYQKRAYYSATLDMQFLYCVDAGNLSQLLWRWIEF